MKTDPILATISGRLDALADLPTDTTIQRHERLNAIRWQAIYQSDGLSFSRGRRDQEPLRKLTEAGLLDAHGATQGKAHKMTERGVLHDALYSGYSVEGLRSILAMLAEMEDASAYTLPRQDTKIAIGFELVESAGKWWKNLKTDEGCKTYSRALHDALFETYPLFKLGYVIQNASQGGRVWAFRLSDAGRRALTDWPTFDTLPAHTAHPAYSEAWSKAYQEGRRFFATTNPPADSEKIVPRFLPASGWM
jgi:hypothetical protein